MKKILIAEDEESLAKALKLTLTKNGYATTTVYNGKDALDFLKKEDFDLLLLDIMMPILDGVEVIQNMKKFKIEVPIVVLSNYSQADSVEKVRDLGVNDYMVKSNTTLEQIVKKVVSILK